MSSAGASIDGVEAQIRLINSDLDTFNADLEGLKLSLEKIVTNMNAVKVTDAEKIVSPITTKVEPVSTQTSKLIFLFPNLLVLMIMFMGLLLSGTLIIMEKGSRAFFRNFTTPTRDEKFILGNFITSILIVLAQVIVVLLLA